MRKHEVKEYQKILADYHQKVSIRDSIVHVKLPVQVVFLCSSLLSFPKFRTLSDKNTFVLVWKMFDRIFHKLVQVSDKNYVN